MRIVLGIVAIILAGCAGSEKSTGLLHISPYTFDATESSAKVRWVLGKNDTASFDLKLKDPAMKELIKTELTTSRAFRNKRNIQTAHITGLLPGTAYRYNIRIGANTWNGSFRTMTAEGDSTSFLVYGSPGGNPNRHGKMADIMAGSPNSFVLCMGNMASDENNRAQWKKEFFGPATGLLSKTNIRTVRSGTGNGAKNHSRFFHKESSPFYYTFTSGPVRMVVVDTEINHRVRKTMMDWLEKTLFTNTSPWVIVAMHRPLFNVSGPREKWGRKDLLPILEKFSVDLVVAGHSKVYERFRTMTLTGGHPVTFLVTGGGGAKFHRPKQHPLLVGGTAHKALHFLEFKATSERLDVTAQALEPDSTLDRFSLTKGVVPDDHVPLGQALEKLK